MIEEITTENIDILDHSFINKQYYKKELENNPFGKMIVLIEKKEIIGFIYYSDIYERVEINQFEIKNIHRNCGKGDFLLKKLIEVVDKNITLEVKKTNIPAIKLYEKNSFIKTAVRKGYYHGIDGILMERKKNTDID